MLKCWTCDGRGATGVNSAGWGERCQSCGGTGNAGCMQMMLIFICAVFGCLLAPISTISIFIEAKGFGYVPAWLAWPLAIAVGILWYLFYFRGRIWKHLGTAAGLGLLWIIAMLALGYKAQAPGPIVPATPVVAPSPSEKNGGNADLLKPPAADSKRPSADKDKKKDAPRMGDLVLRTSTPILKDVNAWVEVDDLRRANWAVGDTQVRIALAAGTYRVAVYSIPPGGMKLTVYDKQVTITGGATTSVNVGP